MKRHTGGIGAAHRGLFDRTTIHCAPEGEGGGSGPSIGDRIAALEAQLTTRAPAAPAAAPVAPAPAPAAAPAAPAFDMNAFAAAIATAMQGAQSAAPAAAAPVAPVVAAPAAPTGPASPATQQGIVDLWALNDQQIAQLGPSGLRTHFEAALAVGRSQQQLPSRPKAPPRGGR